MLKWIWLSVLVIITDQISKTIATEQLEFMQPHALLPFFNLTLVHNQGAAFSFLHDAGGWQRWMFVALAIIISSILVIWIKKLKKSQIWLAIAISLVLGGALANAYDRLIYGYVIDFIDVYYQNWHFPAFNIADSAISIGAVMLLIEAIFFPEPEHE